MSLATAIDEALSAARQGKRDISLKVLAQHCNDVEKLAPEEQSKLGEALHYIGVYAECIRVYELASKTRPLTVHEAGRLFDAANKCGDHMRAFHWGNLSLAVDPNNVATLNNLGIACVNMGERANARKWYMRALALAPHEPAILNNCALTDRALGNYESAVARMLQAKDDIRSDNMIKNMANLLYYVPDVPMEVIDGVHREWYARFGANRRNMIRRLPHLIDPEKKLKIALVSSDWRNHPVGRNFLPIYETVNRDKFEFIVLHQHGLNDEISKEYEAGAKKFIPTLGYHAQAVAQMIANENCDIAIHFAGRFDDNRPMVAAYKPAPINVSYLDAGRFHIPEMDYLIVGRRYAPRNLQEMGTERILGIPRFYQHRPINPEPIVPPPFIERGFFTFGSYNSPVKLNDKVFAAWERILDECPASMLYLRYRGEFNNKDIAKRVLQQLPLHKNRIILDLGEASHLKQTMHIDLHLDTFPFCGSTTTFELAWMGVPTLTVTGGTIMSNYGSGINHQLGLSNDFTAHTVDEYVQKAIYLYNNPEQLIELRRTLRDTCTQTMCKPNTAYFERWMRTIWRRYCKTGGEDGPFR